VRVPARTDRGAGGAAEHISPARPGCCQGLSPAAGSRLHAAAALG